MQENRPKLTNPEDYALVKEIYFHKDIKREESDLSEQSDRKDARIKNLNKNSR